ncbi:MAG TPA: LacI family transcriptional regulator [Clostridiales bacterium]|nr:LacI family transcriptional regulator [Clostridiales bacterium]
MAATIHDVAKHAGVSIGTVSRAINNYKDISPETKERVFKSIKELGYTPNVIARGLSSKTTSNIGVIVSGLLDSNRFDNLWYMLLQGIYRYTSENDLEVAIYPTNSKEQTRKSYTKFCKERNIAGAIISGITITDVYFKELVNAEIPCVVIDVPMVGKKVGCVSVDNIKASAEITDYLISNNHTKLCVIAGKKTAAVTLDRMKGINQSVMSNGLQIDDEDILYCDFSQEIAYKNVREYIEKHDKSRATAFVCMSDIMAMGAIDAIKDCGYSVPGDFSVTGFDDIPVSQLISPALTTIRQDLIQIGYESAALLKKIIDDPSEAKHVYAQYQLMIRSSVRSL